MRALAGSPNDLPDPPVAFQTAGDGAISSADFCIIPIHGDGIVHQIEMMYGQEKPFKSCGPILVVNECTMDLLLFPE
jgi:hypothetical protein